MRTMRVFLTSLAIAVLLCRSDAVEPIAVTWHASEGGGDVLQINGKDIEDREGETFDQLLARAVSALHPGQDAKTAVRVTIPERSEVPREPVTPGFRPVLERIPSNLGYATSIFRALVNYERDVEYFYKGKKVRRYLIRGSDKGTREDPLYAKYWLDGEFLGTWNEAREKFEKIKWEKDAVADVRIDTFFGSGIGFWGLPQELTVLLHKNGVSINSQMRLRAESDR